MDLTKFKDTLTPEDFAQLEESITTMVESLSEEKAKVLTEAKVDEINSIAEDYCEKTIKEKVEEHKAQLDEEYKSKLNKLEETFLNRLDAFLETEINENISDALLEKIAINETLLPIVDGVKKLFEERYVSLDIKGHGLLKKAVTEIDTLQGQVSESIKGKMDLVTENENLKAKLLIAEKTIGLTEKETSRVKVFFEGKSHDEIETRIDDMIDLIRESVGDETEGDDIHETKDASAENDVINESLTSDDSKVKKATESKYKNLERFL